MRGALPTFQASAITEDYVSAFESAWSEQGHADLASYVPNRDHPLYLAVLRELVCAELEFSRRAGRIVSLDDYRARHPELFEDREAVAALAFQDYRLRLEAGEDPDPASYAERFGLETGDWAPQKGGARTVVEPRGGWLERAAALYQEHQREAVDGPPTFPGSVAHAELLLALGQPVEEGARGAFVDRLVPGDEILGFRLLKELGRGAFGRVFLARQEGLAGRPVALKVGVDLFDESQTLAQLQHTNIVPIHSVHRDGRLQAVCMPYFGPTTLAAVLKEMAVLRGAPPPDDNAFWRALAGARPADSPSEVPESAALRTLRGLDHVRACLWVVARLAEGLAHAHERGVLHRDLKPANILLADDGQPMLLDFNLAIDARVRGGIPALFGGTLPFMAPEQLEGFLGLDREPDARGDVYALGLILHELLTGSPAFPVRSGPLAERVALMIEDRRAGGPAVGAGTRRLTPAVRSILQRCLDPDPGRRYGGAGQLAEDLRRQFEDRPLRHAPERSARERLAKWFRRNPRLGWAGGVALLGGLLLALSLAMIAQGKRVARVEAAEAARQFRREFREAEILLSLPSPATAEVDEGERLCRAALARFGRLQPSGWTWVASYEDLDLSERERIRDECGELFLWLVRSMMLRSQEPAARALGGGRLDEALRLNQEAERVFASADLDRARLWQRARLLELSGRATDGEAIRRRLESQGPRASRDHFLLGVEAAGRGELRKALGAFREAVRLSPDLAASWTALGACHATLGEHERAAGCFDVAVALQPDAWRPRFWRGQAYLSSKDHPQAILDFDAALKERPDFVPALFFRALAHSARGDQTLAEADLTRAIALDPGHVRLYFARQRVRQLAGDLPAARQDREEGLRRRPTDELSWVARGDALRETDPAAAVVAYDAALAENPGSVDAAQNKAYVQSEKLGQTAGAVATLDGLLSRRPDFAPAWAGRGVLRARLGQRDQAVEDASQALRRDSSPITVYQVGCIYALTSREQPADRTRAAGYLREALQRGFGADVLGFDPDLAPLRGSPEFQQLSTLASALRPGR